MSIQTITNASLARHESGIRSNLQKLLAIFLFSTIFALPAYTRAQEINTLDAEEIIGLTNEKRQEMGLLPLGQNDKLTKAAEEKANDILNKGYFAHTNPQGKHFYEWIEETGYYYLYAGENLAIDFKTGKGVIDAWMASPTHMANIMNEHYDEIGVYVAQGSWNEKTTSVIVQMFGCVLKDSPIVLGKKSESQNTDQQSGKEKLRPCVNDFAIIPSAWGKNYFDLILNGQGEQTTNKKIVQSEPYHFLVSKEECCSKNPVLTIVNGGKYYSKKSIPVSYPLFGEIIPALKNKNAALSNLPQSIYNNLLISAIACVLLLVAYQKEIKSILSEEKISSKKKT